MQQILFFTPSSFKYYTVCSFLVIHVGRNADGRDKAINCEDIGDSVLCKLCVFGSPSSNVIPINEYILAVKRYTEICVHCVRNVSGCWIRERHVLSPTHKSHNTTILSASEQEVSL